ncbi:uncharacterized protein LOC128309171 [Anopheles moucheti]|uniref:uncharacterized protein LOC128307524 n=1 Tax=Anopheles moucheti TaxID=186751 RepID=UPI0022EFD943|nr:uncharacterized protein LOC128307524 [Anopheles moucheti]XP_052901363.1 uncharacterized protein LOC128307526 [Anopheles moucheti]XP_052901512.1 uncharacterized protein LOC128309146 [Anopheles moucheti]XP_052901526.1 uncharacterized protein LOC128309171 [Anopheles moucheti]
MLLILGWTRNLSVETIVEEFAVNKNTVYKWFSEIREKCASYVEANRRPIGGLGLTVEIDESVVVKRKNHRGRISNNNQVWLVGGICRETKEIFLEIVEKRDRATLHNLVLNNVDRNSTVVTDCWAAYGGLEQHGYRHNRVNHSENFVDPGNRDIHTQNIENLWRHVKDFIRSKGTHKGSMRCYLREYQFKRHNQNSFEEILNILKAD